MHPSLDKRRNNFGALKNWNATEIYKYKIYRYYTQNNFCISPSKEDWIIMIEETEKGNLNLEVPLDASGIKDFKPDRPVKVVIQCTDKSIHEQEVRLTREGKGSAKFTFEKCSGPLHIVVGPADMPKDKLLGMQTICVDLPARLLIGKKELSIPPIKISPYYWHWWLIWCRTFTIRGLVVNTDGEPVPGALVCAYDVDALWWWWSRQQVGCSGTDANGAFEITFHWCCGWLPWWWWSRRVWELDRDIANTLLKALPADLKYRDLSVPGPVPNLKVFKEILSSKNTAGLLENIPAKSVFDISKLEKIRIPLKEALKAIPEFERLHMWPWWPWWPWWDCTPDIIFKVTQNCSGKEVVVLRERYSDARWNIPQLLNVTLVADDEACTIPTGNPVCPGGKCLVISYACKTLVDQIGGNLGANATPMGYANPGAASVAGDRPFAGNVWIYGTVDCMSGIDYYSIEVSRYNVHASNWDPIPMPEAAAGNFVRVYFDSSVLFPPNNPFSTIIVKPQTIDGKYVYETLHHYELNNPPNNWNTVRLWVNTDTIFKWITPDNFSDGTYKLTVRGWNLAGSSLLDQGILPICGVNKGDSSIILTIDNRFIASGPTDSHGNQCSPGISIDSHICTTEPDTAFIGKVKIIRSNGTTEDVSACGNTEIDSTDQLQIDFIAYDKDGHLAYYTLESINGVDDPTNLLSGTPNPGPDSPPVPAAAQVGPSYDLALAQGAVSPIWNGGAMRLTINAKAAFPRTCCYSLVLRAYKRTIVNCDYDHDHWNVSQYLIGIKVK